MNAHLAPTRFGLKAPAALSLLVLIGWMLSPNYVPNPYKLRQEEFEVVEVDVAAITIMVLLGLSALLAPIMGLEQGLVDTTHLFDGFSSNAVMSIIAVMIIGAGLDKTGLMSKVASFILKVGGKTEGRIIPIISGTVGIISSFMQNVGAAALFLPVVSRISARSGLPMSRLLMPMGFTAILGGTVTMVGSSPLILLNDLILTSNKALPAEQQMETWGLFSVTPIGLALVVAGVPAAAADHDADLGLGVVDRDDVRRRENVRIARVGECRQDDAKSGHGEADELLRVLDRRAANAER